MRKVNVFNSITLDGFFTDPNGDMSAFHRHQDPEWNKYTSENASGGGHSTYLFGRKTYEMMRAFWPTPQARQMLPKVSEAMDRAEKVVFSRTLKDPGWTNARVVSGDLAKEVRALKGRVAGNASGVDPSGRGGKASGHGDANPRTGEGNILVMGSGSIIAQLTKERLIDTYTFVIWPFVLGAGRTMFEGVEGIVDLKKVDEKQFKNGNLVVTYELAK